MGNKVTLGGERLGSGNKLKVELHNYERSTHDLSYVWRSTMSSGTLVPFINTLGLPGDTFDIDLDCDVKTHPTIGPLFGRYKVQLDVFQCPIRLYNGKLHMNLLNIGLKMQDIKLPQLGVAAGTQMRLRDTDNSQINPSCILKYLGISGVGTTEISNPQMTVYREFNAVPYLAYWDVYKQYYASKVEEKGAVIHNSQDITFANIIGMSMYNEGGQSIVITDQPNPQEFEGNNETKLNIAFDNVIGEPDPSKIKLVYLFNNVPTYVTVEILFKNIEFDPISRELICSEMDERYQEPLYWVEWVYNAQQVPSNDIPKVHFFDLRNIDTMREQILSNVSDPNAFMITASSIEPYGLPLRMGNSGKWTKLSTQEGLALKTYQSDLFNNWVRTEWIDGVDGVNELSAVDTSQGYFTIDSLNLSSKVYALLNRIAVSGGTYDDWLNAAYTHERSRGIENPMYMGGLIKEIAFQEVVSNSAANADGTEQPLGTLAGRGVMTNKHKGGRVRVRFDEPGILLANVSITPLIDYSQGNDWTVNLKNMNDFHKPALDQIGFQSLLTDQLLWQDTKISMGNKPVFKEVGKQPAWINYMTNVNKCYGNFADENQQMFMTLNRRYEYGYVVGQSEITVKDMTSYIDPRKFNFIFADTRIDAQNFWTQIAVGMTARRKMSAKIIPNL